MMCKDQGHRNLAAAALSHLEKSQVQGYLRHWTPMELVTPDDGRSREICSHQKAQIWLEVAQARPSNERRGLGEAPPAGCGRTTGKSLMAFAWVIPTDNCWGTPCAFLSLPMSEEAGKGASPILYLRELRPNLPG